MPTSPPIVRTSVNLKYHPNFTTHRQNLRKSQIPCQHHTASSDPPYIANPMPPSPRNAKPSVNLKYHANFTTHRQNLRKSQIPCQLHHPSSVPQYLRKSQIPCQLHHPSLLAPLNSTLPRSFSLSLSLSLFHISRH